MIPRSTSYKVCAVHALLCNSPDKPYEQTSPCTELPNNHSTLTLGKQQPKGTRCRTSLRSLSPDGPCKSALTAHAIKYPRRLTVYLTTGEWHVTNLCQRTTDACAATNASSHQQEARRLHILSSSPLPQPTEPASPTTSHQPNRQNAPTHSNAGGGGKEGAGTPWERDGRGGVESAEERRGAGGCERGGESCTYYVEDVLMSALCVSCAVIKTGRRAGKKGSSSVTTVEGGHRLPPSPCRCRQCHPHLPVSATPAAANAGEGAAAALAAVACRRQATVRPRRLC